MGMAGMENILFACDIDNTLIRPPRLRRDGDICVEMLDGAEQSFMSEAAAEMLAEAARRMAFVPVTTRSIEQYLRISIFRDLGLPYALAANGGVLLADGRRDEGWDAASSHFIDAAKGSLETALGLLRSAPECAKARLVDGVFVFSKSSSPAHTTALLRQGLGCPTQPAHTGGVFLSTHNAKIYVIPQGISKGAAIQRLMGMLSTDFLICAGDSNLDLDMLALADAAIVPDAEMATTLCGFPAQPAAGAATRQPSRHADPPQPVPPASAAGAQPARAVGRAASYSRLHIHGGDGPFEDFVLKTALDLLRRL
jgi:hypothetical protein